MSKSKPKREKPQKPYREYPLFAHQSGVWARKIKGKLHYFGPWDKPDEAKARHDREIHYLQSGEQPPEAETTIGSLCAAFLTEKEALKDTGDINEQSYYEYKTVVDAVKGHFGETRPVATLIPTAFAGLRTALAKKQDGTQYSPVTLKRRLTIARMIFVYANEEMGITIRYKRGLQSPSSRIVRQAARERGKLMYQAADIRKLVDKAEPHLKAMVLLGINCAMGPDDCVRFPTSALQDGFHTFARNKTGVERRCPLWPETQVALKALPKTDDHVFNGRKWDKYVVGRQFAALCKTAGVENIGHYSLRRTFETIAKNAEVNQSVIDKIMGHTRQDMSEVYNQHTYDQQLLKCVNYVRSWYLGEITLS